MLKYFRCYCKGNLFLKIHFGLLIASVEVQFIFVYHLLEVTSNLAELDYLP